MVNKVFLFFFWLSKLQISGEKSLIMETQHQLAL